MHSVNIEQPRNASLIANWADYGIRLRRRAVYRLAASWPSVEHMAEVGRGYGAYRVATVSAALRHSASRLAPLDDPLSTNFGLNRWLKPEDEGAYSNWLAWLLGELRDGAHVARLLFGEQLPAEGRLANAPLRVSREVWVPEGHKGHAGRLDCVLEWPDAVVVLELKKGDAEASDCAKHDGYSKWLFQQQKGFKKGLLIATSKDDVTAYGDFQLLLWNDLCKRARRLSSALVASGRVTLAAMLCAFVGAVEQNLLGLPHLRDLEALRALQSTSFQRLLDHLADC